MIVNFEQVSEEIIHNIKVLAESLGYELKRVLNYSNHPSDHFLYVVIGQGGYKNGYVVWMYNSSTNSLFSGTYDLELDELFLVLGKTIKRI